MLLGVIADDFTGASDIANTLARQNMSTMLLTTLDGGPARGSDAAVVALKTRSIPVREAVAQSLAALDFLQGQGCRQFIFKYCSTFDSTPAGNIGPVAEALAGALGVRRVVCCPAFPSAGRTVYLGHLFVNGMLLSESGMEKHPLNPMTDANIRRWLALQCTSSVGLVDHQSVRQGPAAVRAALAKSDDLLIIADAANDADLFTLGTALAEAPLVTGGSGIAAGLAENFRKAGLLGKMSRTFAGVPGPAVLLSGSCSSATRAQIATYHAAAPTLKIDIDALMTQADILPPLVDFAVANRGHAPLIFSTEDQETVARQQRRHGREDIAQALDSLFGQLATALLKEGFSRIVVAGGETSGAVVSALGIPAFAVGPEIAPGVPCLFAEGNPPLALALKSGNFGDDRFFFRAIDMLGPSG